MEIHQRTECQHCEGHIEYPARGCGEVINCPHCGRATTLVPNIKPNLGVTKVRLPMALPEFGCVGGCLAIIVGTLLLGIFLNLFMAWIGHPLENDRGPSQGVKAWEKELRDGVKAYDPGHKLTPEEERLIRSAAEEANRQNPK